MSTVMELEFDAEDMDLFNFEVANDSSGFTTMDEGTKESEGEIVCSKKRKVNTNTGQRPATYESLDLNVLGEFTDHRKARRRRHPLLRIFPSYSKSDSLMLFPNAMSRCLNAGDFQGLSKLFGSHLQQNCDVQYKFFNMQTNATMLLQLFQFLNEVNPNSFMCVHQTKVVKNQIHATMYAKLTICWKLHEAVKRMLTDPTQHVLLACFSQESLLASINNLPCCDTTQERLAAMLLRKVDIEAYVRTDLVLTIDEASKRVAALHLDSWPTSVQGVGGLY